MYEYDSRDIFIVVFWKFLFFLLNNCLLQIEKSSMIFEYFQMLQFLIVREREYVMKPYPLKFSRD